IIPIPPLPDEIYVPPPPSTMAQSVKRARTTNEGDRPTPNTMPSAGPISFFIESFIVKALIKTEVYCSFTAALNAEFT
ncbi:hypothetical protein NEUTE2DRAFT_49425, partial [Neurospora tetrasperma FGSC 2509]